MSAPLDKVKAGTAILTAFFYVYISIMGLLYYFAFYYMFGVNILAYYTLSDYFLSGLREPFLLLFSLIIIAGYLYFRFRRLIMYAISGFSAITVGPSTLSQYDIENFKRKGYKIEEEQKNQIRITAPPIESRFTEEIIDLIRGRGLKVAVLLSLLLLPLSGAANGLFTKYLNENHVTVKTSNQNSQSEPLTLLGSTQNYFLFYGQKKTIIYPVGEIRKIEYIK